MESNEHPGPVSTERSKHDEPRDPRQDVLKMTKAKARILKTARRKPATHSENPIRPSAELSAEASQARGKGQDEVLKEGQL